MKKLIAGILIGFILGSVISFGFAANREELYRKFGPKLIEAIVLIIKDEINILRAEHGLPARTNQQIMNAIDNKLDTISDYEWMNEE